MSSRNSKEESTVTVFDSDMTLRWRCRQGDFVLWARFARPFAAPGKAYDIADKWELKDGNFITVTNRRPDLPVGFDLHPLEVSGSLASWMMERVRAGYKPQDPIEGPNIWRVFAGDRIAWVGPPRSGVKSEDSVFEIVDFKQNALVYGEPFDTSRGFPTFGDLGLGELPPEELDPCRRGWDAVNGLGLPRVASADDQWRIG